MIDAVNRGIGTFDVLGAGEPFLVSDHLRPEQKQAVEFVLQSRDRAVGISGAAGTGKTATLQELKRGLFMVGRDVLAVAPTMSAVEELQKVGFDHAVSLERLLQDPRVQVETEGRVVILDEAGMVSARQTAGFLQLAEARSLRIVFSGDTKQIQSVEAGDALRILEKESRLKSVALTQVQRQSNRDYRDALEELRRHSERGFQKLDKIGAVCEVPFTERSQAIASAYAARGRSSALVVCATHDEIDRVSHAIREGRKKAGELKDGDLLTRHVSLGWSAAQKADFQNYRPGLILAFHRAVQGIAKNETVEVVSRIDRGITVRAAGGSQRIITRKQARCFDVLEKKPIEVAAGDRLLLTVNRRETGLRVTNGEIVTVNSIEAGGRVRLDDGRALPASYRHFTHGYAVTAHRSQGKSVDAVIISTDGMRKELFYVAASRGRQSVTIITSDKERLKDTVARSMARRSASELVAGASPVVHRCSSRGIAMARELVRCAADLVGSIPKRLVGKVLEPRKECHRGRGISR